ncbi:MAG: NADPH-dependent FMN reductase [Solirubrobacterales bacterium]
MEDTEFEIAAICGSLRVGAYTRALLDAAIEVAPPSQRITVHEIGDLPLYDASRDEAYGGTDTPAPVTRLREAVSRADALLLGVTEYNWGPSAPLKNAIDWLSRPLEGGSLGHKPIGMIGASPGPAGTGRAQLQLRQNLHFTRALTMPFPLIQIGNAVEVFDDDQRLADPTWRGELANFLASLGHWTRAIDGFGLHTEGAGSEGPRESSSTDGPTRS